MLVMFVSGYMRLLLFLLGFLLPLSVVAKNGFDLSDTLVPAREIRAGGPAKDGIPAINKPLFEKVAEALDWLDPAERVLGVVIKDRARAYPVKILNWHEIVNDRIDDQFFAVSYCPLCGTGMVFATNAGQGALFFGVSGLLYNSDVLLYDHNTNSLWSQIMAKAISGRLKGTELPQLPITHTDFRTWTKKYPQTEVLSRKTGYRLSYDDSPYKGYEKTRRLYFKVSHRAPKNYHPKERVLGVKVGVKTKAYPFKELLAHGASEVLDRVGNKPLKIVWDEEAQSAIALDMQGKQLPAITGFWFAWYTFYPDTEVFVAQ